MADSFLRLYTAEQVRRLDRCAIEGHGIPGMDLMERAGQCTFQAARQAFPDARDILVFCGGGNNGGDGYVIARRALEAGLSARVCALKSPESLKGDAATAAERWLQAGGEVVPGPNPDPGRYDLLFDALLGTGLDRAPAGDYGAAVDAINASGKPVVAVDIPSGLNADTGCAMGRTVIADLTVIPIGVGISLSKYVAACEKVLTEAGLLIREQRGTWAHFCIDDDRMAALAAVLGSDHLMGFGS